MKRKIPKQYELFGKTYKIVFNKTLIQDNDNCGECHYRTCRVMLQPPTAGLDIPTEKIEAVFFHELVHSILFELGENDLNANEKLVDGIGKLLHQFTKSAKY